jgi:hypothetical protein
VRGFAIVVGVLITALGFVGLAAPSALLACAHSLQTPTALYVIAALRVGFGVVLVRVAALSRAPITLRVLGVLIIIAGIITPFFGVERSRAVVEWWSAQGSTFMRVWAGIAVAFGLFIIYAVTSRRRIG